ncbi:hypothetical protein J4216_01335 [Candidatus Woesearchaeota archaeon]|nr:hypothetical protein [Candidatus Woesearchaeota archaeon]
MDLAKFKGRTIVDVLEECFPNVTWNLRGDFHERPIKLDEIKFVHYQRIKPRDEPDFYTSVQFGDYRIRSFVEKAKESVQDSLGFISLIHFTDLYGGLCEAHIPMIDFDTDYDFGFMDDQTLLETIKGKIRDHTEMTKGFILKSGPKRNYHFVGVGTLLSEVNFVTFVGLALTMRYKRDDGRVLNLVDARHIGHSLTPLKPLAELEGIGSDPIYDWSRYNLVKRFSTLRITPKRGYSNYPLVVDVME